MEAFQGIERSQAVEQARGKFQAFTDGVLILPFSFAVAERCARLRETLRTQKKRVNSRALDLIIAATALEYDLTLITKNTDDFKDITDLSLTHLFPLTTWRLTVFSDNPRRRAAWEIVTCIFEPQTLTTPRVAGRVDGDQAWVDQFIGYCVRTLGKTIHGEEEIRPN
jgi:predicted nucleic acid-binding protein